MAYPVTSGIYSPTWSPPIPVFLPDPALFRDKRFEGGVPVPEIRRRAAGGDFKAFPVDAFHLDASPRPSLAPDYPASNAPLVWQGLHRFIRHSLLLNRQLARLRQARWSIRWSQGGGAFCRPGRSRIHIDIGMGKRMVVQNLAHEVSHAFDLRIIAQHYTSDIAYLDALMRNEALAVLNHLHVRAEIMQSGGVDIGILYSYADYYEAALRFYRRHQDFERLIGHVKSMYLWQINSVERVTYWQSYINGYRGSRGQALLSVPEIFVAEQQKMAWLRLKSEMQRG